MKRSHAVLIVAESLIEPRFDDIEDEASHIVRRLEKAGIIDSDEWEEEEDEEDEI